MHKPNDPSSQKPDGDREEAQENVRVVSAQELFHGDREIFIEHEGEIYRLRITRRNKLILQK
jgi:hemin uptake protein HemP